MDRSSTGCALFFLSPHRMPPRKIQAYAMRHLHADRIVAPIGRTVSRIAGRQRRVDRGSAAGISRRASRFSSSFHLPPPSRGRAGERGNAAAVGSQVSLNLSPQGVVYLNLHSFLWNEARFDRLVLPKLASRHSIRFPFSRSVVVIADCI